MQILITICITLTVLFLLVPLACWFATALVTSNAKTPGEAGVRGLYYLARRLRALAEGADAFLIGYRDVMREVQVSPNCESLRRLEEEKQRRAGRKHEKQVREKVKQPKQMAADGAVVKGGLGERVMKFVFG
jgi:hypothetical protein